MPRTQSLNEGTFFGHVYVVKASAAQVLKEAKNLKRTQSLSLPSWLVEDTVTPSFPGTRHWCLGQFPGPSSTLLLDSLVPGGSS